jgi:hypothetical protein
MHQDAVVTKPNDKPNDDKVSATPDTPQKDNTVKPIDTKPIPDKSLPPAPKADEKKPAYNLNLLPEMPNSIVVPDFNHKEVSTPMSKTLSSCFQGQLGNEDYAERVASSAVELFSVTSEGRKIGSGFVVRNSELYGTGTNAIVTSRHLVEKAMLENKTSIIGVISQNGEAIGWTEVVADAQMTPGDLPDVIYKNNMNIKMGDMVVLRLRGFAPQGEKVFRSIEGIDIAPQQYGGMMVGEFSNPGGIEPGASGSMVINDKGQAIGVMVRAKDEPNPGQDDMWKAHVKFEGGDPMRRAYGGIHPKRNVSLPLVASGYIEPLFSPVILSALGNAALEISVKDKGENIPVQVYGFPMGVCVLYRGVAKINP